VSPRNPSGDLAVEFSLDRFYQLNRRILIWVVLFALIWLLRDFFGLVFLVFFFSFVSAPLARFGRRHLRLPHAASIVLVYLLLLAALGGFVRYVAPRVVQEGELLVRNLGQIEATLFAHKQELAARYPGLSSLLTGYLRSSIPEGDLRDLASRGLSQVEGVPETRQDELLIKLYVNRQMERARQSAPRLVKLLWQASGTTLLALLFSFLIALDTVRLKRGVDSLRLSLLRDFYEQTAQPVVRFGYVVGRAVQAQAVIACLNTALTALGLWALEVPALAPLAFLVFLCSFIPVLGVFLSTTPAVLVALNAGGVARAGWVILMVLGVHVVETYVLNPLVYGRHLRLNPALVLIILYVGHHAFGVWGMVLGVPVAHYLLHDVLGVPLWNGPRGLERRAPETPP
jgi:predicted PurR-regulated permease PerM